MKYVIVAIKEDKTGIEDFTEWLNNTREEIKKTLKTDKVFILVI